MLLLPDIHTVPEEVKFDILQKHQKVNLNILQIYVFFLFACEIFTKKWFLSA